MVSGLLMMSYHVWMIYGTDIVGGKHRGQVVGAFESQFPSSDEIIGGAQADENKVSKSKSKKHYETAPVKGSYAYAEMIGVLHFPTWDGMKVPVAQGTEPDVLDKAYGGHYENSDLPGSVGNFAVAAHRRTNGSNFKNIDKLKEGNAVILETDDLFVVYKVVGHEIVKPEQSGVIWSVPHEKDAVPSKRLMTLTTCHSYSLGAYGNDHRFVVYAEVDYWVYKSDGKPAELVS